jgi:hypothetical protein
MIREKLAGHKALRTPARLADLIAAIQVMGTYKFAVRRIDRWEKRLGRIPTSASTWLEVFVQHPEFFTVIREKAGTAIANPNVSLVWRRSKERNYDTHAHAVIPREQALEIAAAELEDDAQRLSRPPLDTAEISMLVDLAMELHERELKHQQERRWWYAVVVGVAGLGVSALSLAN